jgi:hypothetical protein
VSSRLNSIQPFTNESADQTKKAARAAFDPLHAE